MRQVVALAVVGVLYLPAALGMLAVLALRYVAQAVARRHRARAGPRMSREWRDDFEARMSEHRWNLTVHGQTV